MQFNFHESHNSISAKMHMMFKSLQSILTTSYTVQNIAVTVIKLTISHKLLYCFHGWFSSFKESMVRGF